MQLSRTTDTHALRAFLYSGGARRASSMHISPSTPPYVLSITQATTHSFTHAPLAPFPASLGCIRFSWPLALGLLHDPTLDI